MAPPTKHELISLVESMCEVRDRMLGARGLPEHIESLHRVNIKALIAPVFFLWELLGYGTLFLAGEVDISDCFYLFNIFYPGLRTFFSKPYRHHITGAAAKNFTNRCP